MATGLGASTSKPAIQAYRRILLGFRPASLPKVGSMAQMLALAERHAAHYPPPILVESRYRR